MKITDHIQYIGVNDHDIDLFESQYRVPNGMSYNSYVITDERIAVMDTVDAHFVAQWLSQLEEALGGRTPDYLVVQHMEPDHSAGIWAFMERYPQATIVASMPAFNMVRQFFGTDYADRRLVIKEGSTLSLGTHELQFVAAPMVHWPEVMMTYEKAEKVLFSADAFGKFGALDCKEDWTPEARRYYIGIVGKFGMQVQNLLKKAAALDIERICPLHGPVLDQDLGKYIGLYQTWASYTAEEKGVLIAYASVYGHTAHAVELLADRLREAGCKVVTADLSRCDMAETVANAFRFDRLVLASVTYNAGLFPSMAHFLNQLVEHNYQNRTVAFIENGSWAPTAAKAMRAMLDPCKNLTYVDPAVTLRSALSPETESQITSLAAALEK